MKEVELELLDLMLSEHDFIISEGCKEKNYIRAVLFVLTKGVVYTPSDTNFKIILKINSEDLDKFYENLDFDDKDEIHDIIIDMFNYKNSYEVEFFSDDEDDYDDDEIDFDPDTDFDPDFAQYWHYRNERDDMEF